MAGSPEEMTMHHDVFPTIEAAMRRFVLTREGSSRTAAAYTQGLAAFARFLGMEYGLQAADSGTDALSGAMPVEFYSWLVRQSSATGDPYLPLSVRLYTAAVRAWYMELVLLDVAPHVNVAQMVGLLKKRLPRNVYPHVDPSPLIPRIVAYYDAQQEPKGPQDRLVLLRNRAFTHTLYSTATRISECASLRRGQVAGDADECTVIGKGGFSRRVYLTDEARDPIKQYLRARDDANPYLFISHGRGKAQGASANPQEAAAATTRLRATALTTARLWGIIHHAAVACGAPDVHPHLFRHYRASHWLTDGMPLTLVQELLGHRDIGVTRKVYAHYLGSAARDAFFQYGAPPLPVAGPADEDPESDTVL